MCHDPAMRPPARYRPARHLGAALGRAACDLAAHQPHLDSAKPTDSSIGKGPTPQFIKKQFYGSIELDPIQAKKQFADLVDEVILQFTSTPGVKVKIAIEIQAETTTGFDDGILRVVKENCKVLRFKNAKFENGGQWPAPSEVRISCA